MEDPAPPAQAARSDGESAESVELEALTPVEAPIEKKLWIEVAVVLVVAWLPTVTTALWSLLDPSPPKTILRRNLLYLEHDFVSIVLVLYIMWRSGRAWRHFGLGKPKWRLDGALTLLIFVLDHAQHKLLGWPISLVFPSRHVELALPVGSAEHALVVFRLLINAFSQELLMRAFLIPRLETLLKSTGLSVLLSAGLFASYHIYQGASATVSALLVGLLYGCVFAGIRRVWPLALAHALWNLMVTYRL